MPRPLPLLPVLIPILLSPLPAPGAEIRADGICTLADAIEAANLDSPIGSCPAGSGADTIVLDADVHLVAADAASREVAGARAGLPDVASEVSVVAGGGSVVQRDPGFGCEAGETDPTFRLFNVVAGGHLELRGLELVGGCVVGIDGLVAGGAIHGSDATLVLADMTLRSSTVRGGEAAEGGGVFLEGGALEADGSTFSGNRALAGSVYSAGGAISLYSGSGLEIRASVFEDNHIESPARGVGGGALSFFEGGPVDALILDTVFRDNWSLGTELCRGGALDFSPTVSLNSSLTLDRTIFSGNRCIAGREGGPSASSGGGAVYTEYGDLDLRDVLFEHNEAIAAEGSEGNAGALSSGGAIHSYRTRLDAERAAFVENRAHQADAADGSAGAARGGAVFLEGKPHRLAEVTFAGNGAWGGEASGGGGDAEGGALYLRDHFGEGSLVLSQVSWLDNEAVAGSGSTDGVARGGALALRNDEGLTGFLTGQAFQGNQVAVGTGPSGAQDCSDPAGALSSGGHNVVAAPGDCAFDGPADLLGLAPGLGVLAEDGCTRRLPDGRCLPVAPLGSTSWALDRGSCAISGSTADARGLPRPVDVAAPNAGDGCDAGAFEAQDQDGDGVVDAEDLCRGDDATGDSDGDGECADLDPDDGDPGITSRIFADGFESGGTSTWSTTKP